METKQRYTLNSNERLKSRKKIEQLFKEGVVFSHFPFRIVYLIEETTKAGNKWSVRAGFTVSSKHFRKAVDRNRIKRLMREAYRLQKHELAEKLTEKEKELNAFFIYIGNELPVYSLIVHKIAAALKRLVKLLDETAT